MLGTAARLVIGLRYICLLAAMVLPLDAASAPRRLLEAPLQAALPERFASAMTRARLTWLLHGHKPLAVAIEDGGAPTVLPFFWEAADGSTIRRMDDGSFRLEIWRAAANWTQFTICYPAGWPVFTCADGHMYEMAAPDLSTVNFADRSFKRILPSFDLPLD